MKAVIVTLAGAALAIAGCAESENSPSSQHTGPAWVQRPTAEDFARNYPPQAARKFVSGQSLIHCDVTGAGALTGCVVVTEAPEGMGFGAASLRLAPLFKMRAAEGKSTEGAKVDIPLTWSIMP